MKHLDHLNPSMTLKRMARIKPSTDVQALHNNLLPGTVLILEPGNYVMRELSLPSGDYAIICPTGRAKITCSLSGSAGPITSMISEKTGVGQFYLHGIDFDCNWNGNSYSRERNRGNFKLGAVSVRAWQGKIENCTVKNFGCDGKSLANEGNEVFPLRLETYTGGAPTNLYADWATHLRDEPTPGVQITSCRVTDPHFLDGGYCTAIFVRTSQPGAGDRLHLGDRATTAALVSDNYVCVPGGIAYGCAQSDSVVFESNICDDTKCAFNFDTGSLVNCYIHRNVFSGVSQGINLEGASNAVLIKANEIELGEAFFNPVTKKHELSYAVRLNNNNATRVERNLFVLPSSVPDIIGSCTAESNERKAPQPIVDPFPKPATVASTAELDALKSRNANLTETCKELTGKLTDARGRLDELTRRLADADAKQKASSTELISALKAHDALHAEHVKLLDMTSNLRNSLRVFLGI